MAETGATSKEIGRAMGTSHKTVDIHAEKAVQKLGARNRMHAAMLWARVLRERDLLNQLLIARLQLATKGAA